MQTGTKISGFAHLGLIGWAVFGGAFSSEPLPFEVTEVSMISVQEFDAMIAAQQPPVTGAEPVALTVPEPETGTPDMSSQSDSQPDQARPDPTDPPQAEQEPEPVLPEQTPEPLVADVPPVIEQPDAQTELVPPSPDAQPKSRPADRVAPTPVAPPPPDARPDDVASPEVVPDKGAETPQEPKEATAPEEATDRIITEANEAETLAPAQSIRPPSRRPARPVAQAPKPDTGSAVNAALSEALNDNQPSQGQPVPAPSGPPLTSDEKDALRVSVQRCWNVGALSSAALATTVVVAVTMEQDGTPDAGSIRLMSSTGGSDTATKQAFEAARRAIIRCGSSGFDLPAEKYGHWRDIEMTFNPERMRIR